MDDLIILTPNLRKCGSCGTYYYYNKEHDPGEGGGLDPASNTYSVMRYNASSILKELERVVKENNIKNSKIKALESELKEYKERYSDLILNLKQLIEKKSNTLHLQIKYHVIESLTDHLLLEKSWEKIIGILLENRDPIISVKTAKDIIYVANEEYSVWLERAFTRDIQERAKEFISFNEHEKKLVEILIDGISKELGPHKYGRLGYYNALVQEIAIDGLGNAVYRNINIKDSLPEVIQKLNNDKEWIRRRILDVLNDYIKKNEDNSNNVKNTLLNSKIREDFESKEIKSLKEKYA